MNSLLYAALHELLPDTQPRLLKSYCRLLETAQSKGLYELPVHPLTHWREERESWWMDHIRVVELCRQGLLAPVGDETAVCAHRFSLTEQGERYLEQMRREQRGEAA